MNFNPELRMDIDGRAHKQLSSNRLAYFAQSVLWHLPMQDGDHPPLLDEDQARDVLRWAGQPA